MSVTLLRDVNTGFGVNSKPVILESVDAINNGIINLFKTPLGARPFRPDYGSNLDFYLQEPLDDQTAYQLESHLLDVLERWVPRIRVVVSESFVKPNYDIIGFDIKLAYVIVDTGVRGTLDVQVQQ